MLNIWFNRAYATTIHTIELLRQNDEGEQLRIFGTHKDMDSPVLAACDVVEPEVDEAVIGDAYVDWALGFCTRHAIDVFIPRLHLDTISAAREKFTAIGVAVVAGPAGPGAMLEDKAAAYEDAAAAGLAVPPYEVVTTGQQLVAAYEGLLPLGPVCIKPVNGVGGAGFRVLSTEPLTLDELLDTPSYSSRVDEVAATLDAHHAAGGTVPPLMLLPYLPGPEVSVDCLADDAGNLLIAVPRTKISRRRLLVDDPAAVGVARTIIERHHLSSLSNTQVRYWQNPLTDAQALPYLLETNARISGGLHQTALAGVNMPWAAVQLALGRPVTGPAPTLGVEFTTVSTPVRLPH